MDEATRRFALEYRRFLGLIAFVSRLLPGDRAMPAARLLGRLASPYRCRAALITHAMRDALGLDSQELARAWRAWLENHGLSALSFFRYESLGSGWLHDCIEVSAPEVLQDLARRGGLVLTCHCQHQNTLAARIGLACGRIFPLAASAESSPYYPVLGDYIEAVNRDSAAWFGTGRYLFTDQVHRAVRGVRAALESGATVLTLCDTQAPAGMHAQAATLFGRRIMPPSGAIALAVRLRTPLYAAIMTPGRKDRLVLQLQCLGYAVSIEEALASFFRFLESVLQGCPAAWQGWEWWSSLPEPVTEQTSAP